MAMRGSFHSMGRGYAWKRDPAADQQRQQLEQQKVADYRARVVGRRVTVVADIDFGKSGTVVDVVDGMLAVQLEDEAEPHFFDRHELEATR
jgi:hypothetical protein